MRRIARWCPIHCLSRELFTQGTSIRERPCARSQPSLMDERLAYCGVPNQLLFFPSSVCAVISVTDAISSSARLRTAIPLAKRPSCNFLRLARRRLLFGGSGEARQENSHDPPAGPATCQGRPHGFMPGTDQWSHGPGSRPLCS